MNGMMFVNSGSSFMHLGMRFSRLRSMESSRFPAFKGLSLAKLCEVVASRDGKLRLWMYCQQPLHYFL